MLVKGAPEHNVMIKVGNVDIDYVSKYLTNSTKLYHTWYLNCFKNIFHATARIGIDVLQGCFIVNGVNRAIIIGRKNAFSVQRDFARFVVTKSTKGLKNAVIMNNTLKICVTLQWRLSGCDGVPNHQPRDCLLNRLFRRRSKKTSKHHIIGLCEGNSPVRTKGQ